MTAPTVRGRSLPLNDFEGDDPAPIRNKTCMDTAAGRALAYATNGAVTLDGKAIRAAVRPRDIDGITMAQASQAIHALCGREIVQKHAWPIDKITTHLRMARGLIVIGLYAALPRGFRHQVGGQFAHAMWASHLSAQSGNVRVWDPLNPDVTEYGRWLPYSVILDFLASLDNQCGFVPLEAL